MMLDHALTALDALFDPTRLLALFAGMVVGMIFGMLPGLGGVAAVSILLPFISNSPSHLDMTAVAKPLPKTLVAERAISKK